jgi:hypothetical protein
MGACNPERNRDENQPEPSTRRGVQAPFRSSLSRVKLPTDLVNELISRHIAVSLEKGGARILRGQHRRDARLHPKRVHQDKIDQCRTEIARSFAWPDQARLSGITITSIEKGRYARLFEAQVASKCSLALLCRDQIVRLLSSLRPEELISIIAALNTFWSENLRFFTTLLNLPFGTDSQS